LRAEAARLFKGRIEKNLFRQGSQRSDGNPNKRPIVPIVPGTYSGEIR